MKLGSLIFDRPFVLAPMVGITDYPFRRLAREFGCAWVFTEMISAEGLLRKKESFLKIMEDEHPISVQLFSGNPEALSGAAVLAEGMGADAVDINLGCPAPRATEVGAGVALMRFPEKVERILAGVRRAVKCPLTIKIRSGWDKNQLNAVGISRIAEDCGVDAIFLHPRTKVQGFGGRADWSLVRELKQRVKIPVIGNGDIVTPTLGKRMLDKTGCDGVMIGRGALGNPWIFSPDGDSEKSPSLKEREKAIERHFSLLQDHYGEERAVDEIRRHVAWYTKGLRFSASFRLRLREMREKEHLFESMRSFFDGVALHDARSSLSSTVEIEDGSQRCDPQIA
jgi:tRNA-dihydrouridine synthase B